MFFKSPSYLAALAALLAEHDLGYIELVPQNSFVAELRDGIIRAFRIGAREGHRFDQQDWINTFNRSRRVVQLNFVAFGLNEVGHVPMLEGAWPRVNNPMVLNDIEGKLDQAQRYLKRRHGTLVRIRNSRLRLEEWGLAEQSGETEQSHTRAPDLVFMGTIPDSEYCRPINFKFGDLAIAYYENPRTIGEKVGLPSLFKYPQLAVVKVPSASDREQLVVRVEESGMGVPMLCSVDRAGNHKTIGGWSSTDQDSFVRKVAEVASRSLSLRSSHEAVQNAQRTVIQCPSCRKSLRVPKCRSGKVRCPVCQHLFEAST